MPPSVLDPAQSDIARLVRDAQRGDRAAFADLYLRFARMVHGVVLARTRGTDVDDLVQDVFLAALERLNDLREPEAFGGWLATIARNRATDHGRRTAATEALTGDVMTAPDSDSLEAMAVLDAVRSLPDTYRAPRRLTAGRSRHPVRDRAVAATSA